MSEDPAYASAADVTDRIRRREISPVEVMDVAIARIEKRNPSLNALIFTDFDGARKEATKAEAAVMREEALGPLHGAQPIGLATQSGSGACWFQEI